MSYNVILQKPIFAPLQPAGLSKLAVDGLLLQETPVVECCFASLQFEVRDV